jgi:protein-tyrosine phosphatase
VEEARRVRDEDIAGFDYIVAMDQLNQVTLVDQSDAEYHDKIRLFLEYSSGGEGDVPDPYYGGSAGFERVLDLVEEASRGLLETLRTRYFF